MAPNGTHLRTPLITMPFSLPRRSLPSTFLPYPPLLLQPSRNRNTFLLHRLRACAAVPRSRTLAEEIQQATEERRRFRIDKSKLTQAEKREIRLRSKSIPLVADHDPLDIVFEDDSFLVLNKPSYVKMHPSHRFEGGSLLNRAIGYLGYPPRILHRLDMHTTGVVVIMAKEKQVCHPIMQQFMNGHVIKHYLCLVDGYQNQPKTTSFTVDAPIQRSGVSYIRQVGDSNPDAKPAKTVYTILDKSQTKQVMLLQATPHTGRTHQIRVHAASESLPIIGDNLYNAKEYVHKHFQCAFVFISKSHNIRHPFSFSHIA
eukprot:gb/GEZJ01002897.1/.p1 GENE.gb/GEZJ01002897.1/~~gb/GEZJ01002897.1/.p1  ORF type:complete len:314 (-),score=33.39 gb/GEZJ01002897.1/:2198-3139(-)